MSWSAIAYPLMGDRVAQESFVEFKRMETAAEMQASHSRRDACLVEAPLITAQSGPTGQPFMVVYWGTANELPL